MNRKVFLVSLAVLACLALAMLAGKTAVAGIVGSAHDFNDKGYADADGRICVFCHTPHNADTTVTDSPLWNHAVTSSTFTLYSSGTLDASDLGQPDGVSKLCLSCHDGTVNVDAYGGGAGTTPLGGADPANLGTDLGDDHPLSFTYNDALATTDGELHPPTTTASGLPAGGNIDDDMLFGAGNDQMECGSCHDVHNTVAVAGTPLLVKDNADSALCLTCHDK